MTELLIALIGIFSAWFVSDQLIQNVGKKKK